MSIPYQHHASMLFGRPLMIEPRAANMLCAILLGRIGPSRGELSSSIANVEQSLEAFLPVKRADGSFEVHSPRASRFVGQSPIDEQTGKPKPYRTMNGVAIITIVGELVNRGNWYGSSPSGGMVSYEWIKHAVTTAANDQNVKQILIDMQSSGGEAIGAFDCNAAIRKAAATKPVIGFVNGYAGSAGYALLSGCTKIISIAEGMVGSIGVYCLHFDLSAALVMEGVRPTYIYAGEHKIDGNPFEPLSTDVEADLQAYVNKTYQIFVDCVTAGRKGMTTQQVIETAGARMYVAADALALGLIDSIGTFEDLMTEMTMLEPQVIIVSPDGDAGEGECDAKKAAAHAANQLTAANAMTEESEMADSEKGLIDKIKEVLKLDIPKTIAAAVMHFDSGAVMCADADINTGEKTKSLADVTCSNCLRREIAQRDAANAAVTALKLEADQKALEASIQTSADAFFKKHENKLGKAAMDAFRADYAERSRAGDAKGIERMDAAIAALPEVGQTARIKEASEPSPSAEMLARPATTQEAHAMALSNLATRGVTDRSPDFAAQYSIEYGKLVNATGGQ